MADKILWFRLCEVTEESCKYIVLNKESERSATWELGCLAVSEFDTSVPIQQHGSVFQLIHTILPAWCNLLIKLATTDETLQV